MNILCPNCKREIDSSVSFCPHCGHKISTETLVLTSSQKIRIYIASFVLSPFGFIWFFKHFRSDKVENKKVAYTALIITLIPFILIFAIGSKYISSFESIIDTYETNLDVYTELGL